MPDRSGPVQKPSPCRLNCDTWPIPCGEQSPDKFPGGWLEPFFLFPVAVVLTTVKEKFISKFFYKTGSRKSPPSRGMSPFLMFEQNDLHPEDWHGYRPSFLFRWLTSSTFCATRPPKFLLLCCCSDLSGWFRNSSPGTATQWTSLLSGKGEPSVSLFTSFPSSPFSPPLPLIFYLHFFFHLHIHLLTRPLRCLEHPPVPPLIPPPLPSRSPPRSISPFSIAFLQYLSSFC